MRTLLEHKRKVSPVSVNGDTYYVRSWTLAERLHFSELNRGSKDKSELKLMAAILRMSVCDAEGNETFTDADLPELEQLQDGLAGQKLCNEAFELNGVGAGKVEAEKKD